jgi:hypothetical protein
VPQLRQSSRVKVDIGVNPYPHRPLEIKSRHVAQIYRDLQTHIFSVNVFTEKMFKIMWLRLI